MYDDVGSLLKEIAAGEDTYLEFKEVVFRGNKIRFAQEEGKAGPKIAEVMVSMANTADAVIVFGVNNDGEVIGIDEEKRELVEQFVVNAARDLCDPRVDLLLDWLYLPDRHGEDKLCLKAFVPRSQYAVHCTTDGRYLKRIGSHKAIIPTEELQRLLATKHLVVPFEEWPAIGATLDDLDRTRFAAYYRRRFGHSLEGARLPWARLLAGLKLAIQVNEERPWEPTNVGLLLFAERPDRWISGAYIDLAVYAHRVSDGNTADTRRFFGPIPEQIEAVLAYLRASPLLTTVSHKEDVGRRDRPAYALWALQEAIVNAVVHRSYQLRGSQIRIFLFPDRIEVWSPGRLHNTLTPEDLYAGCQPIRRNQLLAGFLRDYESPVTGTKHMETRGEGFLNLVRESERVSGRRPELTVRGDAVCLTIFAGHAPGELEEGTV